MNDYLWLLLYLESENNDIQFFTTEEERSYCYVISKRIYLSSEICESPDLEGILSVLHEIGHIRTNTKDMKRFEEEFYATQWAFDQMHLLDLELNDYLVDKYQSYINDWYDSAVKRKAKNLKAKNEYILKY